MRSAQLPPGLSSFAYVMMESLRRLALTATEPAGATAGTIQLRLPEIGWSRSAPVQPRLPPGR